MNPFLPALKKGIQKPNLKKANVSKTHINGQEVVLETVVTVKTSPNEFQKFKEFVLKNGSVVYN